MVAKKIRAKERDAIIQSLKSGVTAREDPLLPLIDWTLRIKHFENSV